MAKGKRSEIFTNYSVGESISVPPLTEICGRLVKEVTKEVVMFSNDPNSHDVWWQAGRAAINWAQRYGSVDVASAALSVTMLTFAALDTDKIIERATVSE